MRLFKISLLLVGLGSAALAQDQAANLTGETARVFATTRGQALTGAHPSPRAAVDTFLRGQGRSAAALASLLLRSESRDAAGLTHLKLSQSVDGLPVYGAYVKAAVNTSGELVHLIDQLIEPRGQAARSTVSADGAIAAAAARRFPGEPLSFRLVSDSGGTARFSSGNNYFHQNPTATRVIVPLEGGALQAGWLVETWTSQGNQLWHTLIGNGGRVLQEELRTANESYRVFPEHPVITLGGVTAGTAETTLTGPTSTTASPNGWVSPDGRTAGVQSQFRLAGNNAYAYLDRDANNTPDAAGATITDGNFTAAANLSLAPTAAPNQQVAIQNLFYSVNFVHDKLYSAGFNEVEGNFQENNFGRGGFALDSVSAEAQDGSGTNNANFSTPADGSRPRMQMYLWNTTVPNRDGDVDSDIVFHEYGHGLTWRMIGSMSGCMSGAIGEGASDAVSILLNGDDVVGEYSYNSSNGIRRYRYTNYPLRYNNLTGTSVHNNGELFGAILWRAREKYLAAGQSVDQLLSDFVGGMKYIPAAPRYEQMRDGMVQQAGGAVGGPNSRGCMLYKSFAEYGVGQGASGRCTSAGRWTVTATTSVPTACR